MEIINYSNTFLVNTLAVSHNTFSGTCCGNYNHQKINSSFGCIRRGSVTLSSSDKHFELPAGSIIYIPEGLVYTSIWKGEPDGEFYSLHLSSDNVSSGNTERYAMCALTELSTPETGEIFVEIFNLMQKNDRVSKLRATGLFYNFYADAMSYMQPEPPIKPSPALDAAISFIKRNYTSNFGMDELASHCHISEPQLYHLFHRILGTSPLNYRNRLRIDSAAKMVRTENKPIADIAADCGFNSLSYFNSTFRKFTGMTPSEYRGMVGMSL